MSAVELLRRVSLFTDLRDEELNAFSTCLGKRILTSDMILYHKGTPAQSLYVIESGEVRIFAVSDLGHEITFEFYLPGECFGETALLDENLRTTGAMAVQKTVTYTLARDDFLRCLERHPQVACRVTALLTYYIYRSIDWDLRI
jgi:CRP/FNR family transcriptional regulator, cyclic AMP receptor protein